MLKIIGVSVCVLQYSYLNIWTDNGLYLLHIYDRSNISYNDRVSALLRRKSSPVETGKKGTGIFFIPLTPFYAVGFGWKEKGDRQLLGLAFLFKRKLT
jgi:hypothetical protein